MKIYRLLFILFILSMFILFFWLFNAYPCISDCNIYCSKISNSRETIKQIENEYAAYKLLYTWMEKTPLTRTEYIKKGKESIYNNCMLTCDNCSSDNKDSNFGCFINNIKE